MQCNLRLCGSGARTGDVRLYGIPIQPDHERVMGGEQPLANAVENRCAVENH